MTDRNKQVAQDLVTAVNGFCDEKKVAQYLVREHRTLQQNLMRVCIEYLKAMSENTYFDDRNAASVALARFIMNEPNVKGAIDAMSLPCI